MKESDIRKREAFDKYLELLRIDTRELLGQQDDFIRIDCPACFDAGYDLAFKKDGFEYCLCEQCGTLFTNPRPSLEQLKGLHTKAESTVFWVNQFFKPVMEVRREKMFKPRAQKIASLLGQGNKTVGDIGAGFGLFLEELLKITGKRIDAVAIEPSPDMVSICRGKGLRTVEGFIEKVGGEKEQQQQFDFLVAFEILEHLCDPKAFFSAVYKLLKKGGFFYFTTLNGEGFDIQILWDKSRAIFPPQHINFLNPASAVILAESTGFVIEEVATPGKLDWDILEGMIKNEKVGTSRFWSFLANHGTGQCKQELQDWISRNNLSSHMAVLVRKP